jgi:hypothetical protein
MNQITAQVTTQAIEAFYEAQPADVSAALGSFLLAQALAAIQVREEGMPIEDLLYRQAAIMLALGAILLSTGFLRAPRREAA